MKWHCGDMGVPFAGRAPVNCCKKRVSKKKKFKTQAVRMDHYRLMINVVRTWTDFVPSISPLCLFMYEHLRHYTWFC